MQIRAYDIEDNPEGTASIGLVVLQVDETIEIELPRLLPASLRLYHTRLPSAATVTAENLATMKGEIARAVGLLPAAAGIAVIGYACTSGTTVLGEEVVAAEVHKILPGVAVSNPLTAIRARLKELEARRIGLLTPYEPHVSQALADNLQSHGFSISSFVSFNEKEEAKVARISGRSILDAIDAVAHAAPVDAIFVSCTNLRTLDILGEAEKRTGVQVISSNSALAWHIARLAGI